jgi:hypothetical protein
MRWEFRSAAQLNIEAVFHDRNVAGHEKEIDTTITRDISKDSFELRIGLARSA